MKGRGGKSRPQSARLGFKYLSSMFLERAKDAANDNLAQCVLSCTKKTCSKGTCPHFGAKKRLGHQSTTGAEGRGLKWERMGV